jgi:hypothetical protein
MKNSVMKRKARESRKNSRKIGPTVLITILAVLVVLIVLLRMVAFVVPHARH